MKPYNLAAASLAVVGAVLFVAASWDKTLGGFWAILGFVSLVSALLAWLTPYRNGGAIPVPTVPSVFPQFTDPQQKRRLSGWTFVASSVLTLIVIFTFHWERHTDFDVTGILWLLQNAVPFTIVCFLLVFVIGSFISWIRTFH